MSVELREEIARRRTFAIISHPDAGKTTLTENMLLYSGAIRVSGSVTAKKGQKHAASDWMAMEQQRGISITSSALQFEYEDCVINLLDTPGHQDFSEDTYRTLMAVDSAVMVLDAAKGVEAQTRKLFAVCRERGIPIFTFINKMDRPYQDPYDLIDEVESVLGISAVPMTWPVGEPGDFRGVYERHTKSVFLFERTAGNKHRAPVTTAGAEDDQMAQLVGARAHEQLKQDMELVEEGMHAFDFEAFRQGAMTPVFFGSALTHFGVENFLQKFIELAPAPRPKATSKGIIQPESDFFSGFVYKIQANMDKSHRDRVAFIRVVSGQFERGMKAKHVRLNRDIKMAYPCRLFGGERYTIDDAFPGDVMGLVNPGIFKIGDVISAGTSFSIKRFPVFSPESFVSLTLPDPSKRKPFMKGLQQLGEEGVIQIFTPDSTPNQPIAGAVGQLQFDVFFARMEEEYGVPLRSDNLPYTLCRWVDAEGYQPVSTDLLKQVTDTDGHRAVLFQGEWEVDYAQRQYAGLKLLMAPKGHENIWENENE